MFKLIIVSGLFYIMYRLIWPQKRVESPAEHYSREADQNTIDIEYSEIKKDD